jgi:hypothetical protein
MKLWNRWQDRQQVREADMRKELSADLELEAEEQRDAGVSAEEARYAAKTFPRAGPPRSIPLPRCTANRVRRWRET